MTLARVQSSRVQLVAVYGRKMRTASEEHCNPSRRKRRGRSREPIVSHLRWTVASDPALPHSEERFRASSVATPTSPLGNPEATGAVAAAWQMRYRIPPSRHRFLAPQGTRGCQLLVTKTGDRRPQDADRSLPRGNGSARVTRDSAPRRLASPRSVPAANDRFEPPRASR